MSLETLLPVGALGFLLVGLLAVIYYSLATAPTQLTDTNAQAWSHESLTDDDLAYLVFSVYPYHEYLHFPALPMSGIAAKGTQAAQALGHFPRLTLEAVETTQPA